MNRSKIDSIHTQGSASFAQGMKMMVRYFFSHARLILLNIYIIFISFFSFFLFEQGLSGVDAYAKFYQNKSGEFVTEEARQRHVSIITLHFEYF